jgi:F-type H+-transporting ATPase subunit epsilon
MKLDIITPERKIFEGDVYGIVVPGAEGYFELLDNHAPLVAAIGKGKLKVLADKAGKDTEEYLVSGGFVEMSNNKTMVLLEGAETVK